eukprot:scaffold401_cov144-Skeletonema_dohrnii-CCMP3373.AAC.22
MARSITPCFSKNAEAEEVPPPLHTPHTWRWRPCPASSDTNSYVLRGKDVSLPLTRPPPGVL